MRFRARPGTGPAGSGSHPPPKRRRARSAANILIPILLSWAGSEALGQYWFGDPYNYSSYRFTYLSPDAFVTLDNGSWTYRPNTTVTETIVYKKPFGGYFAESTCDYRSTMSALSATRAAGGTTMSCCWGIRLPPARPGARGCPNCAGGFPNWRSTMQAWPRPGSRIGRCRNDTCSIAVFASRMW